MPRAGWSAQSAPRGSSAVGQGSGPELSPGGYGLRNVSYHDRAAPLRAFHAWWSAPARAGAAPLPDPPLADYELLTAALSALQWRSHSGPIRLYTDAPVKHWLVEHKLAGLWDDGVDAATIAAGAADIDPVVYWSAGKLLALAAETAPVVMIDLDFIVWTPPPELQQPHDLAVVHRESLGNAVYLPRHLLNTPPGYSFNPAWSWTALPCNAAFVSFGNDDFRRDFVSEALRFMRGNRGTERVPAAQMVFAEQRLLGMCAHHAGIEVRELLPRDSNLDDQTRFTHLWGYKSRLSADPEAAAKYCRACAARLREDHPQWAAALAQLPELGPYFGQ